MRDASEMDRMIADAARDGAADSFGPYFSDRVLKGSRRAAAPGPQTPAWLRLRPVLAIGLVLLAAVTADWMRVRTVRAPSASLEQVTLADGTRVTLAPGSSLSWKPFLLRSARQVTLDGEALFDVASTGDRFEVNTFNARIVVTGTRFNVQAWAEAIRPETLVSLEEGGVRLEPRAQREDTFVADAALALTPGQTARLGQGGPVLDPRVSVQDAVSWTTGGLALIDVPLGDALRTLERRFGVRLETDAALASRMTTYVDPQANRVEDILDAICFALNLEYRPILDGFHIGQTSQPTP